MTGGNIGLLAIDESIKKLLIEAGYEWTNQLMVAGADKLDEIKGVGPATAKLILEACAGVPVTVSSPDSGMATIGVAIPESMPTPDASPTASSGPAIYIVRSPITSGRRYEIGETFDVAGLTEKQINRLLAGGALAIKA